MGEGHADQQNSKHLTSPEAPTSPEGLTPQQTPVVVTRVEPQLAAAEAVAGAPAPVHPVARPPSDLREPPARPPT